MKTNVIHPKYLAFRSPVGTSVLYGLLLDRINAPGWAWGVFWTLVALLLTGWTVALFTETWREPQWKE